MWHTPLSILIYLQISLGMKSLKLNLMTIIALSVLCSCNQGTDTEKYQNKRDNVIDVHNTVKEIATENDVLIGSIAYPYVLKNYLIIKDARSTDQLIRIFDKNTFQYLASTANIGQGPDEITVIGHIGIDEKRNKFYVSDHGKMKIFSYDMDSVLADPQHYSPGVKATMTKTQFPDRYLYINDTLALARLITPTSVSTFDDCVAKWNIKEMTFQPMPYEHPDIDKKRITFAASPELCLYVECYSRHDLLTICDFDGNLKCNVYGPDWDGGSGKNKNHHYGFVTFCGDKIVAAYSGGNHQTDYDPTKLLVFSATGEYLKTLDVGRKIINFCYDKDNNRLIMNLDDEYQFAYLDLNGLI